MERTDDKRMPMAILGGELSADGEMIAAACMDGVYTLDLQSGVRKKHYTHESYARTAFWLSSNELFSTGYDGQARWFRLDSGEENRHQKLHQFWSWDAAISPDRHRYASVTGQYIAGGYKYEPAEEIEPSVVIGDCETGDVVHRLPHVPSVQAVAFSNDGRLVAAGNLMGEVRIFDIHSGDCISTISTADFTSWGIIKSHCYLGGIFALRFTPDDKSLLLAGMGPMRDPMAGNGKQLWQKWEWSSGDQSKMIDQIHDGENGEGLMEALAVHPEGTMFAMGGRLRGGDWNVALFSLETGNRLTTLKTGYRVTTLQFTDEGQSLLVMGTQGQPDHKKDGAFPDFGRIEKYRLS
ncbi:hypothetical protein LOC67_21330 [Stieleria sp. JC731]|uniref:WD40 repeat domain-containing protein n=1 Tax=Stieleria sp. JC731 TaxID=2894195 RepID=UPI001E4EC61E|nr:hypothetical protein [Stieleria sp. JC731]MCC9603100.1 hypothetical protein [Stieleria sp. JC731]